MNRTFQETLNQIALDARLSPAKLYIFSKMNQENLDVFKAIWPTIPVKRRRAIIQELLEIAEVNFEVDFDPVFLTALGDEDPEVRTGAIKCLWEYEKPSLIAPLIHLLKAAEAAIVREAAASALGDWFATPGRSQDSTRKRIRSTHRRRCPRASRQTASARSARPSRAIPPANPA